MTVEELDKLGNMETAFSIIAGGLITFVASRFFYLRSSEDLRDESEELRQQSEKLQKEVDTLREYNIIMLRCIDDIGQQTGLIRVNFDPITKEPTGINLQRTSESHVENTDSASHQTHDSSNSFTEESNDK